MRGTGARRCREGVGERLYSSYTARDTVGALDASYAQAFQASFLGGWAGVTSFRGSAAGKAATEFLRPYGKPFLVEAGFKRAAELREMSLVTAELVNLALEPRGTWISFGEEMNSIRTRFDRALLSLETGTREDILTAAKAEAKTRVASYTNRIETAVATAEAEEREAAEEQRRRAEEAEKRRIEDLTRVLVLKKSVRTGQVIQAARRRAAVA